MGKDKNNGFKMISSVMPTYARFNLAFERGEGAYLYTPEGQRYLDFASGIGVVSLGHAHPYLIEKLKKQIDLLWHCSNLYRIPEQERLAQRLVDSSFADTVFFCNSGAEAVECALKMVRKYHFENKNPEKYHVIATSNAFHGRTLATIAAGGQEKHLKGFKPAVDGFNHAAFGSLEAMKDAITENTGAILVEPIQGEGGFVTADKEYFKGLRTLADEYGLLLIFDEVQCGIGRTGKLFAHEWYGVVPDIMTVAKGLGGGFPVGACLATRKTAQVMTAGTHGSTFGGNPLAMTAGNAVLDIICKDGFLKNVRNMSQIFTSALDNLVKNHQDMFIERRGLGLMQGLKCVAPNSQVNEKLIKKGMLAVPAGGNVLRLLPPLIIGEKEINEAINILSQVCTESN